MLDRTDLAALLTNPKLLCQDAYVAGHWVAGEAGRIAVTNPARGDVVAEVADCAIDQAREAIAAADKAGRAWAARIAEDRADVLLRWYDLILAHQDDLAAILTAEMGKPLAEAKTEIAYGASFIRFYAEEARRICGETIPSHAPNKRIMVIKQPVGVVASITPWNFPSAMITRKAAPALAAGCSFVARPASQTPLSALALAVLAEEAGIPPGLFSVLPASDDVGFGQEFCQNETVRKVTFTGSTQTGRILLRQAADQVKKVSMELGGNAPFIVFDDADLDAAVEGAIICKFRNAGQTCVCANRIYVQDGIYDAFATKFAAATANLKTGDGFDPETSIGPLISDAALAKVRAHIKDATTKGAEILCGGDEHGPWFEPTVLRGVTQDMAVASEETFGPVAPLFRFKDEEEVIAMANDTIYGLASYFYARDLSRVWRVAEALEYGIVGINTGLTSAPMAPFGGVKQSGLGREGGHHGIDDFLELKYLCMEI